MRGIIDYFVANPEAIATLLVFFLGSLAGIVGLLYTLLASHPVVVRYLGSQSLVYIDSILSERVSVSFRQGDTDTEIHQLRQTDFEIFNSHPKNRVEGRTITISLPTPDVRILGVTVANSDNRTPLLGGRSVTSTVQQVPLVPSNPLLGQTPTVVYPAVVIRIPYLEKALENDRVLVRITYDGDYVDPQVQGARLTNTARYQTGQRWTVLGIGVLLGGVGILLWLLAYRLAGVPFLDLALLHQPSYALGWALVTLGYFFLIVPIFRDKWVRRLSRPLKSPLIGPPLSPGRLAKLQYFDSSEDGGTASGGG